jgi:thioesterase domain-containing protein
VNQLSPPYQLESIVACLIKRIRERQPNGPYYLAGMCQGGLIAYEAARQLTSQGQQVALLALFEPQIPARPARHAKPSKLALCGRKMRFHFDNLKQLDRQDVPRYIRERFFRGFALHIKGLQLRMRKNDSRLQDLVEILYCACADYRPRSFPGRITLFQAANRLRGSDWEIEYWRRLAAKLEMHVIPGYSNWVSQCFVEPNVSPLAEKLKDCLARCALSQPAQISPVGAAHSLEAE